MKLALKNLNTEFKPFGRILVPAGLSQLDTLDVGSFEFYVLFSERSSEWRIGYFVGFTGIVKSLERHPNTPEAFIPISGRPVLIVWSGSKDASPSAFRLDKPAIILKGVWHNLASLDGDSEVLIVENADVIDEVMELPDVLEIS